MSLVVALRDILTCLINVSKVVLRDRRNALFGKVCRRWVALFMAGAAPWRPPCSFCVAGAALWTRGVACFLQITMPGLRQVATTRKSRGRRGTSLECHFPGRGSIWCRCIVKCYFAWQPLSGAPALYALHSPPCTLHSTLHTLHLPPPALHFTVYTLHFSLCTSHFTPFRVDTTLYTLYPPVQITLCTYILYTFTSRFTLGTTHFTLYT